MILLVYFFTYKTQRVEMICKVLSRSLILEIYYHSLEPKTPSEMISDHQCLFLLPILLIIQN